MTRVFSSTIAWATRCTASCAGRFGRYPNDPVEPPPAGPFNIPLLPISSVLRFSLKSSFGHRLHIRGVVTLQRLGKALFVHDETGNINVETCQTTRVRPGDRVDVAGFPAVGAYTPILEDAIVEKLGSEVVPVPTRVTAKQALSGDYNTALVKIDGQILGRSWERGEEVLTLQSGAVTFESSLEAGGDSLGFLKQGTQIQVVGVCVAEADEAHALRGFRVLMSSPADILVLKRPSWWTARHASEVLGWAGLIVLAVLVWVAVLRPRVQQQTDLIHRTYELQAALQEQYRDLFENANDLIQSADAQGKLLYANRAWRETRGYLNEELPALSIFDVISP